MRVAPGPAERVHNALTCRIPGDTEALFPGSPRGDRLTTWALRGYDSRFSTGAGPTTERTAGWSPCHPQTRAADERPCGLLGEGLPGSGVVRPGLEQSESPRPGAGKDLGGLRRAPAVARPLPGSARVPAPGGSVIGAGYCRTKCRPPPDPHAASCSLGLSGRCRDGQDSAWRRHPRSEKNVFTSGGHESMKDHLSVMSPSLMWATSMAG